MDSKKEAAIIDYKKLLEDFIIPKSIDILKKDKDLQPKLFLIQGEEISIAPLQWESDDHKMHIFHNQLPLLVKEANVDMIVFVSETWVSRYNEGDDINKKPSDDPERTEALVAFWKAADGFEGGNFIPFTRTSDNSVIISDDQDDFTSNKEMKNNLFSSIFKDEKEFKFTSENGDIGLN